VDATPGVCVAEKMDDHRTSGFPRTALVRG
jgi:hypothetical protein